MVLLKSLLAFFALISVVYSDLKSEKCKPLFSATARLTCKHNGLRTNCQESQNHGAIVTMICKDDLWRNRSRFITCLRGKWSHELPQCITDSGWEVGFKAVHARKKTKAVHGQVPWHVTLYELHLKRIHWQICGGTIITDTFVLSAAHCVWNQMKHKTVDTALFKVIAGKFNRHYGNSTGDSVDRQIMGVKSFKIPDEFTGLDQNYYADILLIELDQPFEFSRYVKAVCIDKSLSFEKYRLKDTKGRVAGMGLMPEDGRPSEELRYIDLHLTRSFAQCFLRASKTFRKYLTRDKVCASSSYNAGVCVGDSGGGLIFPNKVGHVTKWYLKAVLSGGVPGERVLKLSCHNRRYATFTMVGKYMKWIENVTGYNF